ncbi:uncharacterized protein METZ01_LOCUS317505, partial [marine metagenome]
YVGVRVCSAARGKGRLRYSSSIKVEPDRFNASRGNPSKQFPTAAPVVHESVWVQGLDNAHNPVDGTGVALKPQPVVVSGVVLESIERR